MQVTRLTEARIARGCDEWIAAVAERDRVPEHVAAARVLAEIERLAALAREAHREAAE